VVLVSLRRKSAERYRPGDGRCIAGLASSTQNSGKRRIKCVGNRVGESLGNVRKIWEVRIGAGFCDSMVCLVLFGENKFSVGIEA
jgi:hypothetical protein